jgi:hypothetical protein
MPVGCWCLRDGACTQSCITLIDPALLPLLHYHVLLPLLRHPALLPLLHHPTLLSLLHNPALQPLLHNPSLLPLLRDPLLCRSPKGVSDLVALDAKMLLVARRFTGIRCSNAPIKFALSPGTRQAHGSHWSTFVLHPIPAAAAATR